VLQDVTVPDKEDVLPVEMLPTRAHCATEVPRTKLLPMTLNSPVWLLYVLQEVVVPVKEDVLPVDNDPTSAHCAREVPRTNEFPMTFRSPVWLLYVLQDVTVPDKLDVLPVEMEPIRAQADSTVPVARMLPATSMLNAGAVFPMPTFPFALIVNLSVPFVLLFRPLLKCMLSSVQIRRSPSSTIFDHGPLPHVIQAASPVIGKVIEPVVVIPA
jgi:hypothetical protein